MSVGVNLVGLRYAVKSQSTQVKSAESKHFKCEPLNKLTTWMLPSCGTEMSSLSLTASDMMWTRRKNQRYTALLTTALWLSSMHFHTNCICFRSAAAKKLNELLQYVEDNRMELIYTYLNTVLSNLKSHPSTTRLIWPPKESYLQCVYKQLASHLRAWDPSCSFESFLKADFCFIVLVVMRLFKWFHIWRLYDAHSLSICVINALHHNPPENDRMITSYIIVNTMRVSMLMFALDSKCSWAQTAQRFVTDMKHEFAWSSRIFAFLRQLWCF